MFPPATHASTARPSPSDGVERTALDFVHQLLAAEESAAWPLHRIAVELAAAFGTPGAGLADLMTGVPIAVSSAGDGAGRTYPWLQSPEVLAQVRDAWTAVSFSDAGRTWLVATGARAADHGGWLVFLEAESGREWPAASRAALVLAGQVLARGAACDPAPRWGRQLDSVRREQRLEDSARVVQRLAHDYGNILTTILGFSELGLDLPSPGEPLATYLHEVHRAALQATQFTDRLRLFSRRGSPGPRSASLAAAVAEEAARLAPLWADQVRLDLDVPAELPPAYVAPDMLRQALRELLDNAREAIPGRGVVKVRARRLDLTETDCLDYLGRPPAGPCLEVTVTDDGVGLSPEARRNVLSSPFFSTKPRHRGLGLASVYGILRLHRGGMTLTPREDGGTTARFVLPVASPRGDESRVSQPSLAGKSPTPRRSRERVLVVDDDPLVLRLVSTTLERDGYLVQTAASGSEALTRYTSPAAEPFRLVLSDVVMPVMNGVDLARRLVQHDAGVNLVFMSGHVSSDFAPENWGGASFPLLRKPFNPEGLLQTVREALDAGQPRPPSPTL